MEYNYYGLYFSCKWEEGIISCVVTLVITHLLSLIICSWVFFLLEFLFAWVCWLAERFLFAVKLRFFTTLWKRFFCIYIEWTHPYMIQLQIDFTDSASELTYLQKYHKGLFILSLKSCFLKCRHFSTELLRMWCTTLRTKLFNHYRYCMFNHHVFSLELLLFKGLQFGIIQKFKFQGFLWSERKWKVLFTKTLVMLRNGGCSLTLKLARHMLARNFDASWFFFFF